MTSTIARSQRPRSRAAFFALLFASAACFAQSQPSVLIKSGTLNGSSVKTTLTSSGGHASTVPESVYKGIPYAAPPVGELRWKPPAAPASWSAPRDATHFGASCVQPPADWMTAETQPSEDCLTLNIWAPVSPARKLPVLVWIHCGGFNAGGSGEAKYDGANLAARGLVVVTINYRLGVIGWMAHPQLTAESPDHTSGNYGLLDQIAALAWVRDNIAAFGGDPVNVTVAGESAGGTSIGFMLASPRAKGLFSAAILESAARLWTAPVFRTEAMNPPPAKQAPQSSVMTNGATVRSSAPAPITATAQEPVVKPPPGAGPLFSGSVTAQNPPYSAAEQIGLTVGPDIATLRALSAADLMARAAKNTGALFDYHRNPRGEFEGKGLLPLAPGSWIHTGETDTQWQTIVDGVIVPAPPSKAIALGCGPQVPILIGTNANEGTLFVRNLKIQNESDFRHYLNDYFAPEYASIRAAYGGSSVAQWKESIAALIRDAFFSYGSNRLAAAETAKGVHVYLYEFDRTTARAREDGTLAYHGAEIPYVFGNFDSPQYDDTDHKISTAMQLAWFRFASTHDPNPHDQQASITPVDINSNGATEEWPLYSPGYPRAMLLDTSITQGYVLNTMMFATFDRNYRRYQTVAPAPVCAP